MPDQSSASEPSPSVERVQCAGEASFPLATLRADSGLSIAALDNGCLYAIECGGVLINQVLASPVAGGVARIYLRRLDGERADFTEIVGPSARSDFATAADRFVWSGAWRGLEYRCTCRLHSTNDTWFFHVEVTNRGDADAPCDVVLLQDLGLATRGQVRNNETFTSQYLDHFSTRHDAVGQLLITRQNLPQADDAHPWLLQGCFPAARGFTSDGFDFFGVDHRGGAAPAALRRPLIGDQVRQYEAGYTAIQSADAVLAPRRSHAWTFFAHYRPDHPARSSVADATLVESVRAMREELLPALVRPVEPATATASKTVFQTATLFEADELTDADVSRLFPGEHRHIESRDGRMWSFFYGDEDSRHVVLKAKELSVARPHGHIMRAGRGLMPDAELMSTACYAAGVFASQLALGHASVGKLLSGVRDPLNLVRSGGLRVFVRDEGEPWRLLGVPSAFEMARDQCAWRYKRGDELLQVRCTSGGDEPAFTFDLTVEGAPLKLLIVGEIAAGPHEYESSPQLVIDHERRRITVRPDVKSFLRAKQPDIAFHVETSTPQAVRQIGGDELLFPDRARRRLPYFAIQTAATRRCSFTIRGSLSDVAQPPSAVVPKAQPGDFGELSRAAAVLPADFWRDITAGVRVYAPNKRDAKVDEIHDALHWFARDAVVHLSTPRGLEQANGGAWGVRDVCQGPVEFLLSYDHGDVVVEILRRLFAQQYERRGDWPQWFSFPPFQQIQSSHAHGDVVIWPLKALCDYLEHTNDGSILHERLGYTDEETFERVDRAELILDHVDRAIARIVSQFLPGLSLPRYGDGDWDDSLQPADASLRDRMVSSWTTELMYQTLRRYAAALSRFGERDRAATVTKIADSIAQDFRRHMLPGGVVAGFAIFDNATSGAPRAVEHLLHPSDTRTGLRYRLIPMTRGILSGLFTPEQARHHLDLIREHLLFPDGARLMDRPTNYDGGVEHVFRRSESAAFFGREIGLQYVHAHLRYAEALAMMGRADELWHALRVVNPIAATELVKNARPRQRNCYFSSSDAAFADRYQAARDYEKLRRGEVPVDGGWRIYSSGAGIYTNLIVRQLFGLRRFFDCCEFDPVLPRELEGTAIELDQNGRRVRYEFVHAADATPADRPRIIINGQPILSSSMAAHPYRRGALRIPRDAVESALGPGPNIVQLHI